MFIYVFVVLFVNAAVGDVQRLPYDYELYDNVLDPELCQQHLSEMNMFEFYDASFRIPQNMLKGNIYSLGNYHQCLAIDQPLDEGSIRGKYCLIQTESLQLPILSGGEVVWADVEKVWDEQNLRMYADAQQKLALSDGHTSRVSIIDVITQAPPLTLALCLPQSCRVADLFDPLLNTSGVQFNYTKEFCRLPNDKPWSGADTAAVVIFSVIGCLTVASTAYELNHIFLKKATTKPDKLKSSFSVYGNTDRLLTFTSKPGTLDCLDGIRAISILWVITGHSFLVHFGTYVSNFLDIAEFLFGDLKSAYLVGGTFSVDSFLLLSGLLLVYTSANKMKPMKLVKSLHVFYLLRLLRMFPLLAAGVLLQASVFHRVSDGVRWDVVAEETQICRDYWWSALLHVQNIVNPYSICVPQTWYLSVDYQLHILSPLLLFWVLRSHRSAWTSLAAAILGSLTFVTVFTFLMKFPAAQGSDYNIYFYQNTFARTPVFIIGMACGYLLHVTRNKKIVMPWWFVGLGYTMAAALSSYCVYQVHPQWNQLTTNFNIALTRPAWAVSLCWLIIACVNGYAGPINWFLSLKLWKFIARISYALYIFHFAVQFITVGANIMPTYFTFESVFLHLASDMLYTGILSTVTCVLIDAPCATLIRLLMSVIAPPPPKQAKQEDINDAKVPDAVEVRSEQKLAANGHKFERL